MKTSIPDYANLDLSGEAKSAAERMEARAQEPASEKMFIELISPLLCSEMRNILDIGCGTGSLSRRISKFLPEAKILATDKSEGMIQLGKLLIKEEKITNVQFKVWDVLNESTFPDSMPLFDLIISSVMIVYLDEQQARDLVVRLTKRLKKGGKIVFLEQDLMTDSINDNSGLFLKIMEKDKRNFKATQALGLRSVLKESNLKLLERRSFLWTDDNYGGYTQELLERMADASLNRGSISVKESNQFKSTLIKQAELGDFYYGIVYHLIAGELV